MKILRTTRSIREAVSRLMAPGKPRRVAIAAFVGNGARAYIPKPRGVEIICWPKAGGTNPLELRRLKNQGAHIRFVDSLHMKVYWSRNRGVLITSANLSTNALGSGNLKEIGVLLPSSAVAIDDLISTLKPREFNKADIQTLEIAHRKLAAHRWVPHNKSAQVKFLEWFSLPARSEWMLGWCDGYGECAKRAKEVVKSDFNKKAPEDFICCKKLDFQKADWVLTFILRARGASAPKWLYVDQIVRIAADDEKAYDEDYPYQAIQVWTARHYPPPPFAITKSFRAAFREASLAYGLKRIKRMRSTRPPGGFLNLVVKGMKKKM